MKNIAIIGTGPMGTYLLKHLTASEEKLSLTFYECANEVGVGMPYHADINADYMLCNAFSREIPALYETLFDWLKKQPSYELNDWELSAHDISPRAFYPRVLIGEYLQSQFEQLVIAALAKGYNITVNSGCKVTDIIIEGLKPPVLHVKSSNGTTKKQFDTIIIATGHSWPEKPNIDDVALLSPWPYTNLTSLDADSVGVLGSSLSAIDVVIALGHSKGSFAENGDTIIWTPHDSNQKISITMVSHLGIMPEGDFFYPYPYKSLLHITEKAVKIEMERGSERLLDRVFDLLCAELDEADPNYLAKFGTKARTVEGFASAYFSIRREMGGLAAVKRDLKKTRKSLRSKETIPQRYALLRGHEVFDQILRELNKEDYDRFIEYLMPVFGDCYAAVPHLSLARVIALYDTGVLNLVATKDGAKFTQSTGGKIEVETENGKTSFDVVVDGRGQNSASLDALPFANLKSKLTGTGQIIEKPFKIELPEVIVGDIYCLALPQLLERHPFSQGLAECSEHASDVARDIRDDS